MFWGFNVRVSFEDFPLNICRASISFGLPAAWFWRDELDRWGVRVLEGVRQAP